MADRAIPYRQLRTILHGFGFEEQAGRGKGSHRMFVGVVDGRIARYPVRCHREGEVKPKAVVAAVRRRFQLKPEHGVSDDDFYGR